MNKDKLKEILEKHEKFLLNTEGGECANLSSANLNGANLSGVNLSFANLNGANLSFANLSDAKLSYASLSRYDGKIYRPIQINNTKCPITILENKVYWGCRIFTFEELTKFEFKNCSSNWNKEEFEFNKKTILDHIDFYFRDRK